MRLLHPVLLPIVIVFASNTKLLHARALDGDETDVSVRRFLRSDAAEAGGVDGQTTSRVARFIERIFEKSASAPKAATAITKAQVTADEALLSKKAISLDKIHLSAVNAERLVQMATKVAEKTKGKMRDSILQLIIKFAEQHGIRMGL
uniref:RxLR effector protein n=1 Tax=Peronospora matthiolae TaxID=2874970 RepID=A0AAV1VHR8_9STRA